MPNTVTGSYEEVFAKVARLRSGADTGRDWRLFRKEIEAEIAKADEVVRLLPLDSAKDSEHARYAVVSFVDQVVQESRIAGFEGWGGDLLSVQLLGGADGGLGFFRRLGVPDDRRTEGWELLQRRDSPGTAEMLDLYLTCLELGFRGKKSPEQLQAIRASCANRIERMRRELRLGMSPRWWPSRRDIVLRGDDSGLIRAAQIAAGVGVAALLIFTLFFFLLLWGSPKFTETL